MTILNAYLAFRDNAREGMEFYQSVLGGDLQVMTFSDIPGMGHDPSENDKVMHAMLTAPGGLVLMGADTPNSMEYRTPQGVAMSISGEDEAELQRYWDALSADGTVTMPYDTPPWGGKFGMLIDKFGFAWYVSLNA
ncbi:MAG TPA: VOC family protein [Microbacterium sp.]|uniref:VOC family protein n=1 Tax=Microbacterium sp. TaxID=51671 RepID=UPI002B47E675|nr:VOC family protein [Microbacterium sp.]HKT55185.1 VOC family protein [Microbacterium sp.]